MQNFKLGKYKHYKGKYCELIGFAKHSDTLEDLVVYRALYNSDEFGDNALWVKSKSMFFKNIETNGEEVPRFEFIE